jgi:hypothetical protein
MVRLAPGQDSQSRSGGRVCPALLLDECRLIRQLEGRRRVARFLGLRGRVVIRGNRTVIIFFQVVAVGGAAEQLDAGRSARRKRPRDELAGPSAPIIAVRLLDPPRGLRRFRLPLLRRFAGRRLGQEEQPLKPRQSQLRRG